MKINHILIFILLVVQSFSVLAQNYYPFIENKGQWKDNVMFRANVQSGTLFLEKNCFTYHFYDNSVLYHLHTGHIEKSKQELKIKYHAYRMGFINASSTVLLQKYDADKSYYNYFIGNDSSLWAANVNGYQKVKYKNLYPNIDLTIYADKEVLKYDFTVAAGINPAVIRLQYNGVENIYLENGQLVIKTSVNEITEQQPFAYQYIKGEKRKVRCEYQLEENVIAFLFPDGYDKTQPLVIDPVLVFASYSGSAADNFGMTATYDNNGNLYSGGTAFANGYPTTLGAYDVSFNNTVSYGLTDVVISKYDSSGSNLIFSTYIGGQEAETVHSLIVNSKNELLLYGVTSSSDFPVTSSAYDSTFNGGNYLVFIRNGTQFNKGTDIYVAKLNSSGTTLMASTFIGGSNNDGVNHNDALVYDALYNIWEYPYDTLQYNYGDQYRGEIMIDANDNCYVASSTRSNNFPIINGFQTTLKGKQDGVVFKFNSDLSSLLWSTYIGGNNKDAAYSMKVDNSNNVYVAGGTASSDFPVTSGAINAIYQGGKADGFVAKIKADGSTLMQASFLGTDAYDQCYFVELDRFEDVYLVGQTLGKYTVTSGVYFNMNSGQFITKLSNNLDKVIYSTVFGNKNSSTNISPSAFLVDYCQNVYVSGWGANILQSTKLSGMPLTSDAFQTTTDGFNFYLIVLNRDAKSLLYGSYIGGNLSQEHVDGGTSRFDKNGIVYQSVCAGCGGNSIAGARSDFPTTPGAWSNTNKNTQNYNCNNAVFKFDFQIKPRADFTASHFEGCSPLEIQFTDNSINASTFLWDFGNGDTTSLIRNPVRIYTNEGNYTVILSTWDSICNIIDTAIKNISVYPIVQLTSQKDTTICDNASASITSSANGTANRYIWSSTNNFSDTLNTTFLDSTFIAIPSTDAYFYIKAESQKGCSATDSVLVMLKSNNISITPNSTICSGDNFTIQVINNNTSDNFTYHWTPSNGIISSNADSSIIQVKPPKLTTYRVNMIKDKDCQLSDSVTVDVFLLSHSIVSVSSDEDTLFAGHSTNLHASPENGYRYSWTPFSSLDNASIPHPMATPKHTTTYTISISDSISGKCAVDTSITIYVIETVCGEPDIFVPNAFTPNEDNKNDVLYVKGNNIEEMYFVIYDRWGEKVFETKQQSDGWDGNYKGMKVDPDVFVYYLTATCYDKQKYFKKGNVTVIR